MGQRQSSDAGNSTGEAPLKQDYYDLLGVERSATDEEVKKAYRRRALELHPDRNYGNVEEATKLFAEIQSAYEILSDPQERAWYDSHRDVLLRGDSVGGEERDEYSYNIRMTTADEVVKLMLKFKKVEYTDAPTGFYGGLNDFFNQIAKEEDVSCQWQDLDSVDYPGFGSKDDDYEDVVRPFYGAWSGFATKKSYAWKDQYRLSDAPDRRIRRLMEKENQKLRDEAIQEFNDAVRSLVAFIRKRDPRVSNNQKSEAERQRVLREAAAAQATRARAQRQRELDQCAGQGISSWAQSRTKDEHEGGFSSESDEEEHEYDCVVCDKTFKSEAQFHAHEKSKKHVKLLKDLKYQMRKEGKDLDLGTQPVVGSEVNGQVLDEDDTGTHQKSSEYDHPRSDNLANAAPQGMTPLVEEREVAQPTDGAKSSEDSDGDYAPRSTVLDRLTHKDKDDLSTKATSLNLDDTPVASGLDSDAQPKVGKAKQKRAKKAAQKELNTSTANNESRCMVCQAGFSSKTKLFDHIKAEGHAAPLSEVKGATLKGKKKKK